MSSTAGAIAALNKAKGFTKSVEGQEPSRFAPKPKPAEKDKTATPAPKPADPGVGKELNAKGQNIKQYMDATPPSYHKGGEIEKDGKQVINAEKGETVLPNHDLKHVKELAMKHMDGMAEGLKAKKKKAPKKVAPMHEGAAHEGEKKKVHGMHVKKIHGGFHIQHHDENNAPIQGAEHTVPTMSDMHDHMEEHMGEPNLGEPEADAGEHGVPPEAAQAAGLPPQGA